MASGIQTSNGKAFEFACIIALRDRYHYAQIIIEKSPQLDTAINYYNGLSCQNRRFMDYAAQTAIHIIERLEPQLWNVSETTPLFLSLQADAAGTKGDVRDVLIRKQDGWEIGLSCKHNHHAVKHSRLSDTIDFGKEWLNIPCSNDYFSKVVPLFSELRFLRDKSKEEGKPLLWNVITEKAERYYIPVLSAFMDELKHIDKKHPGQVPVLLVHYLLGKHDFYKIITDDKNMTTRVEAVNIRNTLNASAEDLKSFTKLPPLKMPTQFYHIGFKPGSNNTIEVVCDEGWQISMRLHNASSKVEPSLKFDVNLISLPSSTYIQTEPWENAIEKIRMQRLIAYSKKGSTKK